MCRVTIDLVWCRDVMIHVPQPAKACAEFCRVLKPGGRALVYQMLATALLEPGLWHVYAMIGQLTRTALLLSKP